MSIERKIQEVSVLPSFEDRYDVRQTVTGSVLEFGRYITELSSFEIKGLRITEKNDSEIREATYLEVHEDKLPTMIRAEWRTIDVGGFDVYVMSYSFADQQFLFSTGKKILSSPPEPLTEKLSKDESDAFLSGLLFRTSQSSRKRNIINN